MFEFKTKLVEKVKDKDRIINLVKRRRTIEMKNSII